jgi:cation diffusion facilitator family transporter
MTSHEEAEHEGHAEHGAHAPAGGFTAGEARQARGLATVLAIVAVFFGFELFGALIAHSVVLEADALHLLMDVLALAVSLVAMRVAVRRPTPRFTFGMRRAEPVAGIFNAGLVLAATVEIIREAVAELHGGGEPRAGIMLVVAAAALVVNGVSAWLMHGVLHEGHAHGHEHQHDPHAHSHDPAHDHDHAPHHDHDHDHGAAPAAAPRKTRGHSLNLRGV